jgi:hypothetical protein
MVTAVGAACSSGADGPRTFDLTPVDGGIDAVPVPEPEGPSRLASVEAVILEAPLSVAADEAFEVVIELRNGAMEAIELSPCPWFHASFGESGTVSAAHGEMPCDDIGSIGSGERIRLRLKMTAPSPATAGEAGDWAGLGWQIGTTPVEAHIPLPMEGI